MSPAIVILIYGLIIAALVLFIIWALVPPKRHHRRHRRFFSTGSTGLTADTGITGLTGLSIEPTAAQGALAPGPAAWAVPTTTVVVAEPSIPPVPPRRPVQNLQLQRHRGATQPGSYIVILKNEAYQHAMRQSVGAFEAGDVPNFSKQLAMSILSDVKSAVVASVEALADGAESEAKDGLRVGNAASVSTYAIDDCQVGHAYDDALKGFAVSNCNPDVLSALRSHPAIEEIHEDGIAYIAAQTMPWGISRIGANISSTKAGDGTGSVPVDIYILDTGKPNHPDINVVEGLSFVSTAPNDPWDREGHGTHVAGTAAAMDNTYGVVGVAPGARIHALRVLGTGSGSWSDIIAGVNYVTSKKKASPATPMVANMSLGAEVGTTAYNVLDQAIANSIASGVTYCIAAGNSYKDTRNFSPAHVTQAIAVGAYSSDNRFATFSNYGPYVTLNAPGVQIVSTFLNGQYAWKNGTSMATPHVAGAAALYLSKVPGASPAAVKAALLAQAVPTAQNPAIAGAPSGTSNRSLYVGKF